MENLSGVVYSIILNMRRRTGAHNASSRPQTLSTLRGVHTPGKWIHLRLLKRKLGQSLGRNCVICVEWVARSGGHEHAFAAKMMFHVGRAGAAGGNSTRPRVNLRGC